MSGHGEPPTPRIAERMGVSVTFGRATTPDANTPEHDLCLSWVGAAIRVVTDDAVVAASLRRHYGSALVENYRELDAPVVRLINGPAPIEGVFTDVGWARGAAREIDGGRLVLDRSSGVLTELRPGQATVWGDLRRHVLTAISVVNAVWAEAMRCHGYLLFYASAVSRGGRAVMIVGRPGIGKTTTALRLLDRGAQFLADNNALAKRVPGGVRVVGFPRWPRVDRVTMLGQPRLAAHVQPADRAAGPSPREAAGLPGRDKRLIDIAAIYGTDSIARHAMLAAVVRLDWRVDGGALTVRRHDRGTALAETLRFDWNLGALDLSRPALHRAPRLWRGLGRILRGARYATLLASVPFVHVSGGVDTAALDALIEELLASP